jgi:hypothetical protein
MFDLEDMDGIVRSICWPEDYARLGAFLQPDAVVVMASHGRGRSAALMGSVTEEEICRLLGIDFLKSGGLMGSVTGTGISQLTFVTLVKSGTKMGSVTGMETCRQS